MGLGHHALAGARGADEDDVYAELDKAEVLYLEEADRLVAEYDDVLQEARRRLRELYDEGDYPDPDDIRLRFWVERKLFDFAPQGQSKLSDYVFRKERDRWAETFRSSEDEVRQALRESFAKLVAHLADRLTPTPDGKRKRISPSAVENVTEFLNLFDRRNVLGDGDLKLLVDQARKLLNGDAYDSLKRNDTLREFVGGEMTKINEQLDTLITDGPRRAILLPED